MKQLTLCLFFLSAVICPITHGSEGRLKPIGVDEQTATRFSIIDKSGGLPGTDPCTGGYGDLKVFGEVPLTISLEDDAAARSLAERAKVAALKACPRFAIDGSSGLTLRLIKGTFDATAPYEDPTYGAFPEKLVQAPWDVYSRWTQLYRREPMKHEYINAAASRATLAKETVRPISANEFLFLLGTDPQTGVNFWIYSRERRQKCWRFSGAQIDIVGEVPDSISLLDDTLARSLVIAGAHILSDKCPNARESSTKVFLVPPNGALGDSYSHIQPVRVEGRVWGGSYGKEWPTLTKLDNYVVRAEHQKLQKIKEAKQTMEVRNRYDQFVKKHGVTKRPTIQELTTNPFVYEGVIVAIDSTFEEMTTPTQGVFDCRVAGTDHPFVVSGIPKGMFTKRVAVVLAGRVLGKTELKRGFGSLAVPHLNFVAVHFCADWGCRDIILE